MYEPRFYRDWVNGRGLSTYTVTLKESDLRISTETDLSAQAETLLRRYRRELEEYIGRNPLYRASLEPVEVEEWAPAIIKEMASAARVAGVGPMAAVAGAVAQNVGEGLSGFSREVIVENGGDIYLRSDKKRTVGIFAGRSPLSGKFGLVFEPGKMPLGVCTSSATVGPSLSFGKTDAAVAVARTAILADAAATVIGNAVRSEEDIEIGLGEAQKIPGVNGALIIIGDKLGVWGDIELRELKR